LRALRGACQLCNARTRTTSLAAKRPGNTGRPFGHRCGGCQLKLADPGVPAARAVAIALCLAAVGGALTEPGAGELAEFGFHQLGDQPGHAVAQHIGVLVAHELVDQVGSGHPVALGHRGVSFVDPWTDRRSCGTRWPNSYPRLGQAAALLHHHLRRDPTRFGKNAYLRAA
jgi:hypothetical protein